MAILREILSQASEQLRTTGRSDTPFLDALLLASKVLHRSKELTLASLQEDLTVQQQEEFLSLLSKRASGVPCAYLLGQQEFFSYQFKVAPGVLIPRPDTELLVEQVLEIAAKYPKPQRILDLCCGSGCIGIAVKLEAPEAEVTCSDISDAALGICRQNASNLQADVNIVKSSLFEHLFGPFDIIVTNPPYLTASEMTDEQRIARGEPSVALHGGDDGLELIREIILQAYDILSSRGCLLIECSIDQTRKIRDLMDARGYSHTAIIPDLTGRGRVVTGSR